MSSVCTRTMTCTCPDCAAFSGLSLKGIGDAAVDRMGDDGSAESVPIPKPAAKPTVARKKPAVPVPSAPATAEVDALVRDVESRPPAAATAMPEDAPIPMQNRLVANSPPLKASGVPPAVPADPFGDEAFGGGDAPSAAPDNRPLGDRLADKNAMKRKGAYASLQAIIEAGGTEASEAIADHVNEALMKKIIQESSALTLEAGLGAAVAIVSCKPGAHKVAGSAKDMVPLLINKAFNNTKTKITECARDIVVKYMETDGVGVAYEPLLAAAKDLKKKKAAITACECLSEALKRFKKQVKSDDIVTFLPTVLNHTDGQISAAGVDLFLALRGVYKSQAKAMLEPAEGGKSAILPQVVAVIGAKLEEEGVATGTAGLVAGGDGAAGAVEDEEEEEDEYDVRPAENILGFLESVRLDRKVEEKKWQDKVAALDSILDAVKKIVKLSGDWRDYVDTVQILKRFVADSNQAVALKAINVYEALCVRLRERFRASGKVIAQLILPKLKDKKMAVIVNVGSCLDAVLTYCVPLGEMAEEFAACMDPKNGGVEYRVNTLDVLKRVCERNLKVVTSKKAPAEIKVLTLQPEDVKSLMALMIQGCGDSSKDVRDAGEAALGALVKYITTKSGSDVLPTPFKAFETANAKSSQRVKAIAGLIVSAEAAAPVAAAKPKTPTAGDAAAKKTAAGSSVAASGDKTRSRRGSATSVASGQSSVAGAPAAKKAEGAGKSSAVSEITVNPLPVVSDATERVSAAYPGVTLADFDSAKWQDKAAAMDALKAAMVAEGSACGGSVDAVTALLLHHTKNLNAANPSVLTPAIALFTEVAGVTEFSPNATAVIVPAVAGKIKDKKIGAPVVDMLDALAAAPSGPWFVVFRLFAFAQESKTHAPYEGILYYLDHCINKFGANRLQLNDAVRFVLSSCGMGATMPAVKSQAVEALKSLYKQKGPAVIAIVEKASATLDAAVNKAANAAIEATTFDPTILKSLAPTKAAGSDAAATDAGEDYRADIGTTVSSDLIAQLDYAVGKDAWKQRNEALGIIQDKATQMAKFGILPSATCKELLVALTRRFADTNNNLRPKAVDIITVVAKGLGKDVEKYSKFVLQPALTLASDKRPVMKASLMAMLDAWVAHNEISVAPCVEKVLHALPEPLANPNGRTELLEWAARHVDAALSVTQETPLSPASLSALVPTVVSCLLSKDSASRTASQKLLGCIIRVCGRAGVDKAAKELKPAEQRSVNDMITAAATAALLSSAGGSGSLSSTVSAVSAPSKSQAVPTSMSATILPKKTLGVVKPPPVPSASSGLKKSLTGGISQDKSGISGAKKPVSAPKPVAVEEAPAVMSACELDEMSSLRESTVSEKAKREQFIARSTWKPDETELSALVDAVKSEWEAANIGSPQLTSALFPANFNDMKAVEYAFDVLSSMIQVSPSETNKFSCDNYAAIVSNADLLYKWLTARMLDNNVQSTNSLVTFLVSLMDMLRHNGYTMTDGEASILLPSLVERLGNQKQRFRDGYRLAMRLVCFVYPASKSVAYLLNGLQSKNVRSRAEGLDELAHIVSETGYRTVGRKGLQKIAALIATGEKDVRDTAIDVIEAVWMQLAREREAVFTLLDDKSLSDKTKALLDARFAHSSKAGVPAPGKPRIAVAAGHSASSAKFDVDATVKLFRVSSVSDSSSNKPATLVEVEQKPEFPVAASIPPSGLPSLPTSAPVTGEDDDWVVDTDAIQAAVMHETGAVALPQSSAVLLSSAVTSSPPRTTFSPSSTPQRPTALTMPPSQVEEDVVKPTPSFPGRKVFINDCPEWLESSAQSLLAVVAFHRSTFKSSAELDVTNSVYQAGLQGLNTLYDRVHAGQKEDVDAIARNANTLITTLSSSLHSAFGGSYNAHAATPRSAVDASTYDAPFVSKLLSLLYEIFYHKELSRVVEARPLCQIIGEMSHRIFDPRVVATAPVSEAIGEAEAVAESGDDSNLQATMNKITMRIAYRSMRENVFAAIFRLLQRCTQPGAGSFLSESMSSPYVEADTSLPQQVERYLIMLLVRLTKYEENAQQRQGGVKADTPFACVDCAIILQELHTLFDCLPLKKDPKAPDDKPLAAAKTVLREMTRARGVELLQSMGDIPPNSAVRQYFRMYLARFRPDEAASEDAEDKQVVIAAAASADPDTKCSLLLTKLMELSRDGGTDARGTIDELWQLRQAHPELDGRIEAGIDSLPTLYREIVRTRLSMLRIKSASSKPMMAAPASDVDKEQETMLARIRARQQQKAASSDSAVAAAAGKAPFGDTTVATMSATNVIPVTSAAVCTDKQAFVNSTATVSTVTTTTTVSVPAVATGGGSGIVSSAASALELVRRRMAKLTGATQ